MDTLTDHDVAQLLAELDALPETTEPARALTGMQAQGDVLLVPTARPLGVLAQALGDRPVPVVAQGNGHAVRAAHGRVLWEPTYGQGQVIGVLDVAPGAVAVVEQPGGGHHPLEVGPGRYEIRRQRERRAAAVRPVSGWVAD